MGSRRLSPTSPLSPEHAWPSQPAGVGKAKPLDIVSPSCGVDGLAVTSRPLTGDEELWWRAMHGGTGVCVVGLQLAGHVSMDEIRATLERLSARHPVLAARIIKLPKSHRPELHVSQPAQPITVRERALDDVAAEQTSNLAGDELLHAIVEAELNTPTIDCQRNDAKNNTSSRGDATRASKAKDQEASVDVFQVHVYASDSSTFVALRSHIAALDEHSAPPIAAEFLKELRAGRAKGRRNPPLSPSASPSASLPPPLAALLPKSIPVKSTLTHAFSAINYVRNALISSHLPFEAGRADSRKNSFRTRFVTVTFTREETAALLAAAESHKCSLFALECAAGLKAAARMKQLGGRSEVFSLGSAIGCRPLLDPPLPGTALGEYMSMLPLKQEVSEKLPFWDVARSITTRAESALARQQQFTDMPVLELLFSTAMKMPSLSPEHSLRTCFLTAGMLAPLRVDWQLSDADAEAELQVRAEASWPGAGEVACIDDEASCSGTSGTNGSSSSASNSGSSSPDISSDLQLQQVLGPVVSAHGVGPAIAIPDTLSDDVLRLSFVFVMPLFTHERMSTFAALTRDFLLEAASL